NEDNWTGNKQKEHNTYLRTLGVIVATGSNEERSVGTSSLNNFTFVIIDPFVFDANHSKLNDAKRFLINKKKEANSDEVNVFWKDVEHDRNAKEFEAILENLDMTFTVERTLEHNDYINEVGQWRRQVIKRTSENYQEEKSIDSSKNDYSLRKKQRQNYNEEEMIKRQYQYRETSPSPRQQPAGNLLFDNSRESDTGIEPNCPAIINDVFGLQLGPLPRKESRWLVNDIDVSKKWHLFKEKSLELANKEGLFVESHTQQILSLSHIFLLKPKQHCPLMTEVFGDELLEMMHKDIIQRLTKQETEFDDEILIKLVRIVKRLQRGEITRDNAVSELQILAVGRAYGECAILKSIRNIIERVPRATLKSPIGELELCTTYIDPILSQLFMDPDRDVFLRWSNKEAMESKVRKPIGRAKQPDAIINEINQLSWGLSKGHGEAKVQEEMNNLYLLCTDLIRIAIFNKDAIDFYNMNCMLGFQVVGHHITFYLTTLLCDALYVMVEVGHVDVPMSLEQVPAFLTSLDTLLIILNAYWSNCIMSTENKEPSRRSTLATPSFKEMVSKSRDRHRPCQLREAFEKDEARIEKERQNEMASNVVTLAKADNYDDVDSEEEIPDESDSYNDDEEDMDDAKISQIK
ncbi:991_t:CDS:10, partial [Dentiscutata heterogama]